MTTADNTDVTDETGAGALVVIPTYNEADNLEPIVSRVLATLPACHILVVDDGSPDGTGKIADRLAGADPRVHVLHHGTKAGLGAAYIAGFDWGVAAGYDVLVEMDADGSHAPEQLPRLLHALGGEDNIGLVLGSRYVPGGTVVNWPLSRQFLSRGGNVYTRVALGLGLRDATGGFRAYRREVLSAIDYEKVASQGYCFQVDLARRVLAAGFPVAEVPITFVERERGESKMSGAIVREALLHITRWGARHRFEQLRGAARVGRPHKDETGPDVASAR
jgi:dolichol-phosphate mannosyltransferase